MQLVVKILSTTETSSTSPEVKLPFLYDEKKAMWTAASDAIKVGEEAVIGIHAECGGTKEMMGLLVIHRSEILANLVFRLSDQQMFSIRFSERYMIAAEIDLK